MRGNGTFLRHESGIGTVRDKLAAHKLGGITLAGQKAMERICDHCRAFFAGKPYRVRSEESGVVLLDMIVCHYCYLEARKLGLHTEEPGRHALHGE